MIRKNIRSAAATIAVAATAVFGLAACSGNSGKASADSASEEAAEDTVIVASTPDEILANLSGTKPDTIYSTPSGLRYIVVEEGNGASPSATDEVSVYYTGMLTDGTVFDSTSAHGDQPISFPLNRVISGWTEGLQLMKEGGKYVFYIPSDLAYGPNGQPGVIPPDAPLVFEVELVKVGK